MAANHWETAIEVHQAHFPDAAHDLADITQVDPRRWPRTDILLASPECTNHSQSRGVSRKRQQPSLWDAPDPAAERSRATMWDVVRFAEQMLYEAVVVENVVEATKWVLYPSWLQAMRDLGYEHRVLSLNSMHFGVPQSRDRIYIVFWRKGAVKPDLDLELPAWCARCEREVVVRQGWKPGRSVGRYRQQWEWLCTTCGTVCEPPTTAAATIIDWELDCPRIGDRPKPLAKSTRDRIAAGLARYGWLEPVITSGAGNVHERTPGNRARRLADPLATLQTTATHAIAAPPDGLPVQPAHQGPATSYVRSTEDPLWSITASDSRAGLVVSNMAHNVPTPTSHPTATVTTGNKLGVLTPPAYLVRNYTARGVTGQMTTPVDEPARTVTTKGHQSLLMPYYGRSIAQPVKRPIGTIPTRDRYALVDTEAAVDDCGFRMLEPHECAAAMAFPTGYIPGHLPKTKQVKLAGNAVTPPVPTWIVGRILQALEARR